MSEQEHLLRAKVAKFILENARESECLFEVIADLGYGELGLEDVEDLTEQAYGKHSEAKVAIIIDGVMYGDVEEFEVA